MYFAWSTAFHMLLAAVCHQSWVLLLMEPSLEVVHLWVLCLNRFRHSSIQVINSWKIMSLDNKSNILSWAFLIISAYCITFTSPASSLFQWCVILMEPFVPYWCRYLKFHKRCLSERKRLGIGCSEVKYISSNSLRLLSFYKLKSFMQFAIFKDIWCRIEVVLYCFNTKCAPFSSCRKWTHSTGSGLISCEICFFSLCIMSFGSLHWKMQLLNIFMA